MIELLHPADDRAVTEDRVLYVMRLLSAGRVSLNLTWMALPPCFEGCQTAAGLLHHMQANHGS